VPFCAVLGVIATAMLATEPPRIGSITNHLVVSVPYLGSFAAIVVLPEAAGAILGALAFTGPLTAVRLVDRRQIVAHYFLVAVGALALIGAGLTGPELSLALLLMVLCIWASGFGDLVYLEAAESQGNELERLVRRDPLTGAGNRRLLAEQLDLEFRRHARTRRPLTVLALDLNGFKKLNDEVGHAAGDALLKDVAVALQAIVGPEDTVVRQGGDEFCVLLPETSSEQAFPIANAIRAAIEAIGPVGHAISTGVGAATFPTDASSPGVVLHVADMRLRHDKLLALEPRPMRAPSLRLFG
jgi:diguanylate cyclase (GGDEF)-like protein